MVTPSIPGTEALSVDAGPVGVLLSHGFTGSPASMTPWGRFLAEQGYSVRVPRLPGHGTSWQDMNTTGWTDWYGTVDDALTELTDRCDSVIVGGLSMGGALALRLSEQRPNDVAGLILVNPAIALKRFDVKLVPLLSKVRSSVSGIGNDIAKPDTDELGYDRTPLTAMASQLELWRDVRSNLSSVKCPLLYFRSSADHVVDDLSQKLILEQVASEDVTFTKLENSYHVATIDNDAERIWSDSADFIAAHTSS